MRSQTLAPKAQNQVHVPEPGSNFQELGFRGVGLRGLGVKGSSCTGAWLKLPRSWGVLGLRGVGLRGLGV